MADKVESVERGPRVWVAGHNGMVGQALLTKLGPRSNVLKVAKADLDLTCQSDVDDWVRINKPEVIYLCAAKVGGIRANSTYPADFLYQNLAIQTNVIESARRHGVNELIFLGSSCTYPREAAQPILESSLMKGPPEETNVWYAVAKIAGLKLVEAYRRQFGVKFFSVMPANCYGPGDNFSLEGGHVIPAMLRKIHHAKVERLNSVTFWGTGRPQREFIYVDDLADALLFLTNRYDEDLPINIGTSEEIKIRSLAGVICEVIGYEGEILFDTTYPDGAMRKVLDSARLEALGWKPKTTLVDGITKTYNWCIQHDIL
jgi:GDP-L-fucose synthase